MRQPRSWWRLFNGLVGFLLFRLSHHFHGRRLGLTSEAWGVRTSRRELARTLVLAVTLAFAFFLLVFTLYYLFHVDLRFLFVGVRPFRPVFLVLLLMYAQMFLPFFVSNSLRVNGALRLEGEPEWKSMLLAGIANSLGLFFIVVVQYATFALTGTVHWTEGWLYINLLFAVVPIMFVLPYFLRIFFRMTG